MKIMFHHVFEKIFNTCSSVVTTIQYLFNTACAFASKAVLRHQTELLAVAALSKY